MSLSHERNVKHTHPVVRYYEDLGYVPEPSKPIKPMLPVDSMPPTKRVSVLPPDYEKAKAQKMNRHFDLLIRHVFYLDEETTIKKFDRDVAQAFVDSVREQGKLDLLRDIHASALGSDNFQTHMNRKYDPYAFESREYVKAMVFIGDQIREI